MSVVILNNLKIVSSLAFNIQQQFNKQLQSLTAFMTKHVLKLIKYFTGRQNPLKESEPLEHSANQSSQVLPVVQISDSMDNEVRAEVRFAFVVIRKFRDYLLKQTYNIPVSKINQECEVPQISEGISGRNTYSLIDFHWGFSWNTLLERSR
ncbi:hypothetical protein CEXT_691451 [Caerostris extrusa]|uniref:Uncharacterized protein n=1 Tax=Caerostris extrusa TaxID=172846 RepID=A0AAV4UKP1_CAEEX|nr:hypothetical protein CEXT_691451 [Caerostris extrusa]